MLNISKEEIMALSAEIKTLSNAVDFDKLVVEVNVAGGCSEGTCYGGCAEGYN